MASFADLALDECNSFAQTSNHEKHLRFILKFMILVMGNVIALACNARQRRKNSITLLRARTLGKGKSISSPCKVAKTSFLPIFNSFKYFFISILIVFICL